MTAMVSSPFSPRNVVALLDAPDDTEIQRLLERALSEKHHNITHDDAIAILSAVFEEAMTVLDLKDVIQSHDFNPTQLPTGHGANVPSRVLDAHRAMKAAYCRLTFGLAVLNPASTVDQLEQLASQSCETDAALLEHYSCEDVRGEPMSVQIYDTLTNKTHEYGGSHGYNQLASSLCDQYKARKTLIDIRKGTIK